MEKINIMINGLPGNVAETIFNHAVKDERFSIVPASLTGPGIDTQFFEKEGMKIELLTPDLRDEKIGAIKERFKKIIAIDYTHPTAVNQNAEFYIKHKIPFVMGTTGGDREKLLNDVKQSEISAVIAPNMAKQIVGFQAMMEYAAKTFPDLFKGYSLEIKESHQAHKADTSGTAKAMVGYFNSLGMNFSIDEIKKERDPKKQNEEWGVPEEYISGHAWHTYTLVSPDKTTKFEFKHNINGRDIYVHGTLDAVNFLSDKLEGIEQGTIFTMIDVLKG